MDSPNDDVEQLKNNYKDYAEAVVKAVMDYKGLNYIANTDTNYYTVQKGDTLYNIATKYGLTVNKLKEMNNLSSNILNVGQTLKVKEENETNLGDYNIYVVQKEDNLYNIAKKFDVTVDTLKKINNLTSNNLQINQQLLIPKSEDINIKIKDNEEGIIYKVKSKDTLYNIAKAYNVSVDEIKKTNNLTSNSLQVGDELIIPISETEIIEVKPKNSDQFKYIVQKGDNLYSIANKFNTTVNGIKQLNNLSTNVLQIDQELLIPGTEDYAKYYVKKNDTLYSIANKFNTTVSNLKAINNLVNNNLSINQVLLIPK